MVSDHLARLEDGYVVVDLCAVLLGDALGDPDDVAALLLLELEVRVEDSEVELLQEGVHVQFHLVLEELVLQRLVAGIVAGSVEQGGVLCVILGHGLHLLVVVSPSQSGQAVGVHLAAVGIQLGTVVLGQLGAERVDGDDDRTTIGLKSQNLTHDVGGGAAHVLAEVVERLQICLVEGVTDDLNVHLVQILLGDAVDEEGRQGRVHQNGVVQLGGRGRHMDGLHLLEAAQWVALGNQLGDGSLVQRAGDQQDDVVDHVAVGDEVQEVGQRLHSVVPHVLELDDQLFAQLVVDDGHRQGRGLVGQEAAIVGSLQMQLEICKVQEKSRL